MQLTSQNRRNLTRMTRNRNPSILLIPTQNVIQKHLVPVILVLSALLDKITIQLILLGEPLLEAKSWPILANIALRPSAITSVAADALSQEFLDNRLELLVLVQFLVGEGDTCGFETTGHGGGVVDIWEWELFILEARGKVGGGDFGLADSFGGDKSVGPGCGCITVEEGPVALFVDRSQINWLEIMDFEFGRERVQRRRARLTFHAGVPK